jgi:hypothetical protein
VSNVRVDIVGGVLKQYPAAVVTTHQFDGGINYEVKVPGRTYKVRHSVEWGDNEAEALAYILDRLAGPDTWNGR